MAQAAVSSVASYLSGLLIEETKFLGGVAEQIDSIHRQMAEMQCFLKDADSKQHESEGVRKLVADIKDLAYDAEDIIESYILKAKYASNFNPKKYIRLHQIGNEMEKLQSKIQEILPRMQNYNFIRFDQGEGTSSTIERQRLLRRSYPHIDDEDVVGIQDYIELLVAKLMNKEGPRVVSIVGMGGLGKTTLATKVYNHDDVKRHFDCCAWSFVSHRFQVRTILQGIIRKVWNPNEEMRLETFNDEELIEMLSTQLKDMCYLVVLDDIWSTEAWEVLKSAFPKGKMGSKIILTTTIRNVALHADPKGFLLEPECLTEERSWELFCKKTSLWKNFASSSSSSSLPYLPETEVDHKEKEKLGRGMIKRCGGLPLAITVLGGLLATKQTVYEWEMVAKDIGRHLIKAQQQKEHGVSWILSLSYHDLPFYLKSCFLYLACYPEDTEFHKRELIHMWMAEGFVQHDGQGTTKEEMGEEYLFELINRSMIQVAERNFRGKVKKCRLHDLIRDLCLEKAKEENFFLSTFDGESSRGTTTVESTPNHQMRRYAIHGQITREKMNVSMKQLAIRSPHLRALTLQRSYSHDSPTVPLKSACKNFNFLRVLKLDKVKINKLPRAIGKLLHLKYLGVTIQGGQRFIKVPAIIGNLRSLQFLVLEGIVSLPNVLWKMEKLTYCRVRYGEPFEIQWSFPLRSVVNHSIHTYCGYSKPLRVDGLMNLMTLELWVPRGMVLSSTASVPILTSLQKLFLYDLDIHNSKLLHQVSISRLDRLQCFGLSFRSSPPSDFDWSPLSSCRNLRKLCLKRKLWKLPQLEEFPPNLTKLELELNELEEEPIATLEMLPNMESLKICSESTKFYFSAKGFGKLQYLRLHELRNLEELEVEKGALPCLVHLQIVHCHKIRMLPEGLRFITSLKKLEVEGMPERFNRRLRENGEDWLKIQHIPSIMIQK